MRAVSCLVLVGALSVGSFARADFDGLELGATYYTPDLSTPYSDASFSPSVFTVVTTPGSIETTGNVEDLTMLPVDFTADTLTIRFDTVLSTPTWNAASFNGIIFELQGGGDLGIAAASVDAATSLVGFDDSRVTFDGTKIFINWQGLSYLDEQQVVVNFTFGPSAVPEPATATLMGTGIVGLVGYARRRNRGRAA